MYKEKQTYVAQYHARNRDGQWNQPDQASPRFKFKALDDESALDIALSFAEKPMMYAAGIRKRVPIPEARYELINLFRLNKIPIKRTSPLIRAKVCQGKDDFDFFV